MVFAENLPSRMDFSAPLIVKKIIYADSRENNSILAAAILAVDQADQQKKVEFLRKRHVPTPSKRMGITELR